MKVADLNCELSLWCCLLAGLAGSGQQCQGSGRWSAASPHFEDCTSGAACVKDYAWVIERRSARDCQEWGKRSLPPLRESGSFHAVGQCSIQLVRCAHHRWDGSTVSRKEPLVMAVGVICCGSLLGWCVAARGSLAWADTPKMFHSKVAVACPCSASVPAGLWQARPPAASDAAQYYRFGGLNTRPGLVVARLRWSNTLRRRALQWFSTVSGRCCVLTGDERFG